MMQSGDALDAEKNQIRHGTVLESSHPQPAPIVDQATHVDPAILIQVSRGLAAGFKLHSRPCKMHQEVLHCSQSNLPNFCFA